jgi:hypothetical protein
MDTAAYKKAYLLKPYTYEKDYARTESAEEGKKLFYLLREAYKRSQTPIEIIPSFPQKEERVEHFLSLLRDMEGIRIP